MQIIITLTKIRTNKNVDRPIAVKLARLSVQYIGPK